MSPRVVGLIWASGNTIGQTAIVLSLLACLKKEGLNPLLLCPESLQPPVHWKGVSQWRLESLMKSNSHAAPLSATGGSFVQTRLASLNTPQGLLPVSSYERFNHAETMISLLKTVFSIIVVLVPDCSVFGGIREGLSEILDDIYIGLSPITGDVLRVKEIMGNLFLRGIQKNRVNVFLLNQQIKGGLPNDVLKENFPQLQEGFSYEIESVISSENEGIFVQDLTPKSKLAREIKSFSNRLRSRLESSREEEKDKNKRTSFPVEDIFHQVIRNYWQRGAAAPVDPDDASAVEIAIDQEIKAFLNEKQTEPLSQDQINHLRFMIKSHVMGWGPLEKYMTDPSVNEIMVNGHDQIFIEREGSLFRISDQFMNLSQLKGLIERLVRSAGRRVDIASPMCDFRLEDGSRVNVVLPPISLSGPVLTIRRFRPIFQSMEDLLRTRTLNQCQANVLKAAVEAKKNIVISGNSGAGKTTLLNVLSHFIGENERVVTVEDTAELQLQRSHVVRLESRRVNTEGEGEISMSDLVVNALRMRPDRIIVGECRGIEAIPMLQAMNTGHHGSLTTLHANSAKDAVQRLESMVLLGAPHWPIEVVRQQIASAVNMIVYIYRSNQGRYVSDISSLDFRDGALCIRPYPIENMDACVQEKVEPCCF